MKFEILGLARLRKINLPVNSYQYDFIYIYLLLPHSFLTTHQPYPALRRILFTNPRAKSRVYIKVVNIISLEQLKLFQWNSDITTFF